MSEYTTPIPNAPDELRSKWFNLYRGGVDHGVDGIYDEMYALYHDSEAEALGEKTSTICNGRMRYIGTYEEKL